MKEAKMGKCPFCGGENFMETAVGSYGGAYVTPATKRSFRHAPLYATVCLDCGSVVRSYCKHPERLLPKNKRGDR